jgi:hypothetical protein
LHSSCLDKIGDSYRHTSAGARVAVGREAPRPGVGELAARRDRVVVASDARRGGDARKDRERDTSTSTAPPDASEPLRAGPGPVDQSETRSRNPPRVQRASQLETTRRCASFASLRRAAPTSNENQSTRRRGGRGSPRTTLTRLGSGGAILRAAQPHSTAGPCPRRRAAPTARAARVKREG